MKENEMIERYIFEVTRRVPQDMREEIGLELRTLIDDMCTEEQSSVEEVLQKLGSPAELTKDIASVKSWSPNLLPPIPDKRAVISRGDSVVSIIFITVFAAILFFAPQLFGAFHYDGNKVESIACVFNLNEWNRIMPIFILSLFVGLIDEIIRLVTGYYCKAVMYSSIICNTIQIIGAVILLKCFQLWNPDFAREIQKMTGVSKFSSGDVLNYWGSGVFDNVILAGICIISCIEVGITVYKTVKYS